MSGAYYTPEGAVLRSIHARQAARLCGELDAIDSAYLRGEITLAQADQQRRLACVCYPPAVLRLLGLDS